MPAALLLLALSQYSMWTDKQGVVHVETSTQASARGTPLEGGGYSVIDGDGRPKILPDGGTRTDDAAFWRARFQEARLTLKATEAQERAASRDLQDAQREVCATATARAVATVHVFAPPNSVVNGVPTPRGGAVFVETREEATARACQRGTPSAALVSALQGRRLEKEQAAQALHRLEQEALVHRVPLREWY